MYNCMEKSGDRMPSRKFKTHIEIVPKQSKQLYDKAVDMDRVAGQHA